MNYKYTTVILSICLLLGLVCVVKNKEPVSYIEQEQITTKVKTDTTNISETEVIVYITKYGTKYHRENCRYLRKSKTEIQITIAEEVGFEPCYVCKP